MKIKPRILTTLICFFALSNNLDISALEINSGNIESSINVLYSDSQQAKADRLSTPIIDALGGVRNEEKGKGSRLTPSNRKKDHWSDYSEEDEINTIELEEREYRSTIKKIKESDVKNNFEVKKTWIEQISAKDHMEIFISGGGYRGGVDPVVNDRIMVSNSGLLQKHYETESGNISKYDKKVDRNELTELIKWIAEKGFFSYDSEYTCESADKNCYYRLNQNPKPIPLKVVIAVGQYRNVVTVPIFAPDMNKEEYINYPPELKKIVEAIYVFASL